MQRRSFTRTTIEKQKPFTNSKFEDRNVSKNFSLSESVFELEDCLGHRTLPNWERELGTNLKERPAMTASLYLFSPR
jgi:hypothetical protein